MLRIVVDGQELVDGFAYASMDSFAYPVSAEVDGQQIELTKETMTALMMEHYIRETGTPATSEKDAMAFFEDRYLVQARQMRAKNEPEFKAPQPPQQAPVAVEKAPQGQPMTQQPVHPVAAEWFPGLPQGAEVSFFKNVVKGWELPVVEYLRTVALLWIGTPAAPSHLQPRLQSLLAFLSEFPVENLQEAVDRNRYTMPMNGTSPAVMYGILMERVLKADSVVQLRAVLAIMAGLVSE